MCYLICHPNILILSTYSPAKERGGVGNPNASLCASSGLADNRGGTGPPPPDFGLGISLWEEGLPKGSADWKLQEPQVSNLSFAKWHLVWVRHTGAGPSPAKSGEVQRPCCLSAPRVTTAEHFRIHREILEKSLCLRNGEHGGGGGTRTEVVQEGR